MADKSFEQQVQENLAGLRIKPDVAVWLEVERALHKERKRRWLIWLFLFAAGTGAAFWVYENFNPKAPESEIITINPITTSIKPVINEKDTVTVNETTTNKIEESSVITNNPELTAKIVTNETLLTTDTKTNESSIKQLKKKAVASVFTAVENKEAKLAGEDNLIVMSTSNKKSETVAEQPTVAIATQPVTGIDSTHSLAEVKPIEEIPSAKIDGVTETKQQQTVVKTNKKNPWRWNINVDAGKSGLRSGLSFGKAAADNVMSAPGLGVGNATPPAPVTKEPTIKDAFSFGLQLEATKKIGKKSSFGISAGYLLMQNKTGVGQKVDINTFSNQASSRSSYYYISTDSVDYTNQYHFLQLGANLYLPFTLFKVVTFRWQLGTGLNFLIATNGLHYDAANGRLFENSSLFTKTQPYFSTGLDIGIGKQPFLYIGPHWLSSFSSISESNSKHLARWSIQASFVLPKKKK